MNEPFKSENVAALWRMVVDRMSTPEDVNAACTMLREVEREMAAAESRGYERAREQAAKTCEREAEKQREGARLLRTNTSMVARAARTYCEERERTADFLADDIRAMTDEK